MTLPAGRLKQRHGFRVVVLSLLKNKLAFYIDRGSSAGADHITPTMSLLNYARDERVLIVGLTAAIVGVVTTARMLLTQVRDKAEIKPPQPTTQYITQETEDSLKPTTLDTILGHYNYAIREIAAKIVCDRAVNDGESVDYLLWGITRPDYDERMKCLRTLAFITDPRTNYHHDPCR